MFSLLFNTVSGDLLLVAEHRLTVTHTDVHFSLEHESFLS